MLAVAGGRAVEAHREERPLPRIMRLAGINSRREVTIIGRPAVPVAGDGDVSSARGALG